MPSAADVLSGAERWAVECGDCLEWLGGLPDGCVSLTVTSPPYEAARLYGPVSFKLRGQAWVDWFRPIVVELCRVTAGLVCVNAAGQVKDGRYSPIMEFLTTDLYRLDGIVLGPQPYAWVRPGIPGSGNKHYHRRNWEPVYCYARPDRLPLAWSDNLAFGKPPKWAPGGEMSHRVTDGHRRNQWGKHVNSTNSQRKADGTFQPAGRPSHVVGAPTTKRRANGVLYYDANGYLPPAVSNPSNVIRTGNGGNQMGHPLAHENEAPMNLAVAERFVCWYAPPDSVVLDCFAGSGTTGHAAIMHGRRFVGCDVRQSQVALCTRRLRAVTPALF